MTIRFVKEWKRFPVGREMEWPSGAADLLIRRGFAVQVSENKPSVVRRVVDAVAARPVKSRDAQPKKDAKCRRKW